MNLILLKTERRAESGAPLAAEARSQRICMKHVAGAGTARPRARSPLQPVGTSRPHPFHAYALTKSFLAHYCFVSIPLLLLPSLVLGQTAERPQKWAVPVQSRNLENAFRLDSKLYRSAQPSRKGFQEIKGLGITNVLNLRDLHSDKDEAKGLGLALHHIKAEADEISEQEIISALRIIQSAKGPVLVHCWHGSDRTGAVCAMYRIVLNQWSKEEAIDEMVKGGFGYHKMYDNIVKLIQKADIEKIRAAVSSP